MSGKGSETLHVFVTCPEKSGLDPVSGRIEGVRGVSPGGVRGGALRENFGGFRPEIALFSALFEHFSSGETLHLVKFFKYILR